MGHPIKLHNKTSNKCVAAYIRIRYILCVACVCACVCVCACSCACVRAYLHIMFAYAFWCRFYTIVYTYVLLVHACMYCYMYVRLVNVV